MELELEGFHNFALPHYFGLAGQDSLPIYIYIQTPQTVTELYELHTFSVYLLFSLPSFPKFEPFAS
jgi:hypothetical protein